MIKKPVKIQLSEGLDARPIALLVQEASQYSSSVYIEVDQKQVNAKSIMGMMSLTLMPGEEITVVANGTDEKEAAAGIERFLVNVKNRELHKTLKSLPKAGSLCYNACIRKELWGQGLTEKRTDNRRTDV